MRAFENTMSMVLHIILALTVIVEVPLHAQSLPVRERTNFNAGWLFQRDDPTDMQAGELDYPKLKDYLLADSNNMSKAEPVTRPDGNPGGDVSYVKPDFNDSGWRSLTLPHDWAVEGPFDIYLSGETGKLPWAGVGWYRKHFDIPVSDAGRRLFLDIDGAMSYSTVWVNGQLAGGWPYGYQSFEVDISPFVKVGATNVVAIRLDNPPLSSRWYPGAGIYRNTWLVKTTPVHVDHWSVAISTVDASSDSSAIEYKATLANQSSTDASTQTTTTIYKIDATGAKVGGPLIASPATALQVPAGSRADLDVQLAVAHPDLWTPEHPNRYVAVTEVQQNGRIMDEYETTFGIRTIKFDPDHGFFLNGVHVELNGVCDHADLGALGMAFNTRAAERQLDILKDMGCNALRTSHNPPAPELLDLCDKMGFLVMDESFDCWRSGKKKNDYSVLFNDWHERDLRSQFRRDRNHPSVIIWSLGNEMGDLWADDRAKEAALLTAIAHDEDATRPTAVASNNQDTWKNGPGSNKGIQYGLDMYGQNYPQANQKQPWDLFDKFHAANPTVPVFGSETASALSSRGFYTFPVSNDLNAAMQNFQVSSYDLVAPAWGCPPDVDFAALDHSPYVAGLFAWTGFDYLGEPTPYNNDETNLLNVHDPVQRAAYAEKLKEMGKTIRPSRSSYFGAIDLAGFKKDMFYLYQAHWRPDLPMAHILPHWNWPDRVGKITPVFVYTSGDEAELFLNGISQGRRSTASSQPLPQNLALNQPAIASSNEAATHSHASNAVDGADDTRWTASDGTKQQWWQVDLGQTQPIRSILVNFERSQDNYQYRISTSDDGQQWQQVATKDDWSGDSTVAVHAVNTNGRYVRIDFTNLSPRTYASIREMGVYSQEVTPDSFFQDHYRMRWSNVIYQPGELKVVSYKNGKPWAEASVNTTGDAASLQMEADHSTIRGDGQDLCYITTHVLDSNGLAVPTAQNQIKYEVVSGPGQIIATDNGDPTDLETFSNPERHAFNGLALIILGGKAGQTGDVKIRATSDGLNPAELTVHVD